MDLSPNWTIFIQIFTFALLAFGLKTLLFEPVARVLHEREQRTTGTQHEADAARHRADTAQDEYQRALLDVRKQASQEAASARSNAQNESTMVSDAARSAAAAELATLRSNVSAQVEDARRTLALEANQLATDMLARVTGRQIAS